MTLPELLSKQFGVDLTPSMGDVISRVFRKEEVKKKTTLFMNGDSYTRHYFVIKGLLRLYIIDSSGKEFNLLFAYENQVIGDLASPAPTQFNLDTIEDSLVYSADEAGLRELTWLISGPNSGGADMIRRSYLFLQKRLVGILSRTAEENYLHLRKKKPLLLQRLPQYHVASYLGVSPEFLSKIIARTVKK
jgi:CRP-like cAMP-binding protein